MRISRRTRNFESRISHKLLDFEGQNVDNCIVVSGFTGDNG